MTDTNKPSLLEPESRGGDNAGRGFDFQDFYLVSQIPCWLEWDGFISLHREGISDIEIKLFSPKFGERIEMVEVKSYRLTPAVFWAEIDRFYESDQGSPNTFSWFRLVAPDISDDIGPLQHSLRRLRSPYDFYADESGVMGNSFADFVDQCQRAHKPKEYADFLFHRVLIDTGYSALQEHGEALFRQNFGECLPEYRRASYSSVSTIYYRLLNLTAPRNTPITRKVIEEAIRTCIPSDQLPPLAPTRLHTSIKEDDTRKKELVLEFVDFFGGNDRVYPSPEEWNVRLVGQLNTTKDFILNHRITRLIRVTGNRKLSTAFAIGNIFSATGGFTVMMEHREGVWWQTNDHGMLELDVSLNIDLPQKQHDELIISIGIPNDIRQAVESFVGNKWETQTPILDISCLLPVQNAQQANSIVAQIKRAIRQSLSETNASHIHLFCAVPSFIALLLGHRLNATTTIQCYEYVGPNSYVPTCRLNT